MDISSMKVRITFQKNEVSSDEIGNHTNTWEDYYSCHASVSGENGSKGSEQEAAGKTVNHANTDFTVRYCEKVKNITTDNFRIIFNDEIYDIIGIDHMQYKRKGHKFKARKAER